VRIDAIEASPFALPLKEPFTISRASVATTRAVLVRAELESQGGRAQGLGEAALPLGSTETLEELIEAVTAAAGGLRNVEIAGADDISAAVDAHFQGPPCARSGLHSALLDAWARIENVPVWAALGGAPPAPLLTDITLPIADPDHLAELASSYWASGFRCFKIKVGADLERDRQTLRAVAAGTSSASLRFDANEGFSASQAL
jgi:muconate cycloisomerase